MDTIHTLKMAYDYIAKMPLSTFCQRYHIDEYRAESDTLNALSAAIAEAPHTGYEVCPECHHNPCFCEMYKNLVPDPLDARIRRIVLETILSLDFSVHQNEKVRSMLEAKKGDGK